MEGELIKPENNSPKIETKPIRNEKGQLLPGVVLNPYGKPKGSKHFRTLFMDAVKEIGAKNANGEDISKDKVIVQKVINKAMSGDLKAADMVFDRIDGEKEDAPLININVVSLNKEQKEKLLKLI